APRHGVRQQGIVVALADGGLHVAFTGGGLSAAAADRISASTIQELVKLAREDHVAFVKRIADAVATRDEAKSASSGNAHECRFGIWYESVSDPATMALPAFEAIAEPHRATHECARQALAAMAGGDEV